jgi:2-aminoethylphosphonate-pyruvate transaminase
MQGSGTFGVESVLSSVIADQEKVLIIINGAYGRRMSKICDIHEIDHEDLVFAEDQQPDYDKIRDIVEIDNSITHIALVHCETTTGIINDVEKVSKIAIDNDLIFILDSMSIFGAVEINIAEFGIDYLISSSNKCVQGVPGFSFVIANKIDLSDQEGMATTLSLDLFDQWKYLEETGQFRYTPPIQVLLAFNKALDELEAEGGPGYRAERYKKNAEIILTNMTNIGFKKYLSDENSGYIINTFLYPEDQNFDFEIFYQKLNQKGFVIYPGKLTQADCFRIGNIGDLHEKDMYLLIEAIKEVINEMNIIMS